MQKWRIKSNLMKGTSTVLFPFGDGKPLIAGSHGNSEVLLVELSIYLDFIFQICFFL